jgi:hypothetical protein
MGGCDRGLAGTQPARVFGAVVYLLPRPVDDGIGPRKDPFASATGMTSLRPKERGQATFLRVSAGVLASAS